MYLSSVAHSRCFRARAWNLIGPLGRIRSLFVTIKLYALFLRILSIMSPSVVADVWSGSSSMPRTNFPPSENGHCIDRWKKGCVTRGEYGDLGQTRTRRSSPTEFRRCLLGRRVLRCRKHCSFIEIDRDKMAYVRSTGDAHGALHRRRKRYSFFTGPQCTRFVFLLSCRRSPTA